MVWLKQGFFRLCPWAQIAGGEERKTVSTCSVTADGPTGLAAKVASTPQDVFVGFDAVSSWVGVHDLTLGTSANERPPEI